MGVDIDMDIDSDIACFYNLGIMKKGLGLLERGSELDIRHVES